jgi:hypothetical protein
MIEQIMKSLHVNIPENVVEQDAKNISFSGLDAFDILDVYLRLSTRWDPPGRQGDRS